MRRQDFCQGKSVDINRHEPAAVNRTARMVHLVLIKNLKRMAIPLDCLLYFQTVIKNMI